MATESTDEGMPYSLDSTAASSTGFRGEWEIQADYLVVVHNRPITALFIPSEFQDSPKLPEELTGLRIAIYQWTGTTEVHEAPSDFIGPTYRLEVGTHWTCETLFKLRPSQTRGRNDGVQTKDCGPLQPSGTDIRARPLPGPEEPFQRERERDINTQPDTSTVQKMVSIKCGSKT